MKNPIYFDGNELKGSFQAYWYITEGSDIAVAHIRNTGSNELVEKIINCKYIYFRHENNTNSVITYCRHSHQLGRVKMFNVTAEDIGVMRIIRFRTMDFQTIDITEYLL